MSGGEGLEPADAWDSEPGIGFEWQETVEIDSGRRRVHIDGRGVGPRVVALHGVGGGAYFFRDLALALENRYRIEAPDLPGTGRSRGTESEFSFDDWMSGLRLVLDEVPEPAYLVGHSLGTILALELWRRWPERIKGIIFVGGLPRPREVIRERLAARAQALRAEGTLAGWGPKVSPGIFSPRSLAENHEIVARFERRFEGQDVAAYRRSLELLITADASDVVPTVTVPCASVSGVDDLYAPPEDVAAFLERLPHQAPQILLPDVGHMPFFEAPERFAREVAAVLDAWTGARGATP